MRRSKSGVMSRARFAFLLSCGLTVGCAGSIPPPSGGGGDGNGNGGGGGGGNGAPVVSLLASNATPVIGEQVFLRCVVESGDDGSLTFSFGGSVSRLSIDEAAGRAEFIVNEADIGATYRFTCRAENGAGLSGPSNEVIVSPTATP